MIFLLKTRYLGLDARQKRNERSVGAISVQVGRWRIRMYSRVVIALVAIACMYQATAKPVRRTLNFNMFVLKPQAGEPERSILTTDGISRFGPLLEYLVQQVQGLMSVRLPADVEVNDKSKVPEANALENEVDTMPESKKPGVIVRPSQTKPGTYEVEIDVIVDDDQPNNIK